MLRSLAIPAIGAAMVLSLAGAAFGLIGGPPVLKYYTKTPDAICVGRVLDTQQGEVGEKSLANFQMTFRVDRVLKGDITPGSTIIVTYSQQVCYPRYFLSGYDLVLLKKHDGKFAFCLPSFSSVPVSEQTYSPYIKSSDVEKNVRWEMLNSLASSSPEAISAALGQYRLLAHPEAVPVLKKYACGSAASDRAMAVSALVLAGEQDFVPEALALALKSYSLPVGSASMSGFQAQLILEEVGVPAKYVPDVGRVLASPDKNVRAFAARVLRSSKTDEIIPYLKAALYDSEQHVRYAAVMGLAERTKDYHNGPATFIYQANEEKYLGYWKKQMAAQ